MTKYKVNWTTGVMGWEGTHQTALYEVGAWSSAVVVDAIADSSNAPSTMVGAIVYLLTQEPECNGPRTKRQRQKLKHELGALLGSETPTAAALTSKNATEEQKALVMKQHMKSEAMGAFRAIQLYLKEGLMRDIKDVLGAPEKWFETERDIINHTKHGEYLMDGATSDNQAFLPLVKMIEGSAYMSMDSNGDFDQVLEIFPTVLMTGGQGYILDFHQVTQYFIATIPFKFAAPHLLPIVFDLACPSRVGDRVGTNYNYMLKVGFENLGGPGCQQYLGRPETPPRGCQNLHSRMRATGIAYFEDVTVQANWMWGIKGGWHIKAMSITTQLNSGLAKIWLGFADPKASKSKDPSLKEFPMFPLGTLMLIPVKYAYLLSNYMSHAAFIQQYCFRETVDETFAPFCADNPTLCPCSLIGFSTLDFVFPVMV
jgi:hypothetical protein